MNPLHHSLYAAVICMIPALFWTISQIQFGHSYYSSQEIFVLGISVFWIAQTIMLAFLVPLLATQTKRLAALSSLVLFILTALPFMTLVWLGGGDIWILVRGCVAVAIFGIVFFIVSEAIKNRFKQPQTVSTVQVALQVTACLTVWQCKQLWLA